MVLPGGGLRQLPRLLPRGGCARRGRSPGRARATTSTSAACRPIRRWAGSTTRSCRRSSATRTSSSRGWCSTSSRTRSSTRRTTRRSTSRSPPRSRRRGSRAGSRRGPPPRRRSSRPTASAASGCAPSSGAWSAARVPRCSRPTPAAFPTTRSAAPSARRSRRCASPTPSRRASEPGLAAFDRWFAGEAGAGPNNASLASMGLYSDALPAFRALLARENGDLPRFYARVRELAAAEARAPGGPRGDRRPDRRRGAPALAGSAVGPARDGPSPGGSRAAPPAP